MRAKFAKYGVTLKDHTFNDHECQLRNGKFTMIRIFKGIDKIVLTKDNEVGNSNTLVDAYPREEVVECMAKIIKNDLSK